MKKLYITMLVFGLFACKKKEEIIQTSSTINVINAIIGEANVKVNTLGKNTHFNNIFDGVAFGAGRFYYAKLGSKTFVAVSALDSTKILFQRIIDFEPGVYTLYLSGQSPKIDTLFRKESNYPIIKTDIIKPPSSDSVINIRFVNLALNSPVLKINIKNSTSNEVEDLAYKSIGNWKAYPSKFTSTVYTFEIRNAQTNVVLLNYNFTANAANRFKNVALIISGIIDGTNSNALRVSNINYY